MFSFKYWPYLLLFIVSLIINFVFQNHQTAPVNFPDSITYLNITQDIKNLKLPDFTSRTPTYPIFLIFFTPLFSLITASFGTLLLFWLIKQLFTNTFISFILTLLVSLDYGVINFQATILTESIAPFLILFFLFTNIKLILNKKNTKTFIALLLFSDVLIMFLKPTFIVLPLALNLIYILFTSKKILIMKIISINLIFTLLFLTYNYHQSGKFQISSVGSINSFGLALKNDYFKNQPYYTDAPSSVKETIKIFESYNGPTFPNGPYEMLKVLKQNNVYQNESVYLSEVNRYIYIKNKRHFIITLPAKIISNFNVKRQFYSNYPSKLINHPVIIFLEKFYNNINNLKFVGFVLCFILFIYFFITKNKKFIILGSILLVSFYTVFLSTTFSYAEYSRLREPVDLLLNLLVLLPLTYVIFH